MKKKFDGWLMGNLIVPLTFGSTSCNMIPIPVRRMEAMYFAVVNSYFELQVLRRGFNGCSLYLYLYILYLVYLFIFESCM